MINKQDYLNSFNQDIEMVRGDTLTFNFTLTGLKGDEPTSINFAVTDNYGNNAIFSVDTTIGIDLLEYDEQTDSLIYACRIDPTDTASMDISRYYYDMHMMYNGDKITLIRGRFTLLSNVRRG